jgi:ABC-type transport system involved in multi-copper enzyme maturation permease subunit
MTGARANELRTKFLQQPWRLWLSQIRSIVSLESRRNLFSWRSLWVYFLAFAPTCIILLHALFERRGSRMDEDTLVLAGIFQLYYVRLGIFFGCLGIFTRLIRGEMVERSLHYYLLSPVRREVLLLGKFLAGTVRSVLLFGSAVALSFFLMYIPHGAAGQQYMFDGPGMSQLYAYLGITVLACVAYGSIFLLFSMLMKNPAPAALLLMGWEFISAVLPPALQQFSVASHLRHLMPVSIPGEGIFALLTVATEPVPGWLAVVGVLLLTVAVLVLSCYRMRYLEISYSTE